MKKSINFEIGHVLISKNAQKDYDSSKPNLNQKVSSLYQNIKSNHFTIKDIEEDRMFRLLAECTNEVIIPYEMLLEIYWGKYKSYCLKVERLLEKASGSGVMQEDDVFFVNIFYNRQEVIGEGMRFAVFPFEHYTYEFTKWLCTIDNDYKELFYIGDSVFSEYVDVNSLIDSSQTIVKVTGEFDRKVQGLLSALDKCPDSFSIEKETMADYALKFKNETHNWLINFG